MRKHVPEPLLERFGIGGFEHFVLADHVVRLDCLSQGGGVELLTGDTGENHAVTPRKCKLALLAAFGMNKLWVALQRIDYLNGAKPIMIEVSPEQNFMPTAADIKPHIEKITFIALCSPQNPTGTVFTKEGLEEICDLILDENKKRDR